MICVDTIEDKIISTSGKEKSIGERPYCRRYYIRKIFDERRCRVSV